MKTPARLQSLQDEGFIDSVSRQLMSGKEATVYVVSCGAERRCAKIYKQANNRRFSQAVDYTENRKVKNMRRARAIAKGLRPPGAGGGVASAEVDVLVRLAAVRVRVPQPFHFRDRGSRQRLTR